MLDREREGGSEERLQMERWTVRRTLDGKREEKERTLHVVYSGQ